MTDPKYTDIPLPEGTIAVKAEAITVLLSAAGNGQMVPQLVVETTDGAYLVSLRRDTYRALTEQIAYFANLSPTEIGAVAQQLNTDEKEN